MTNRSIAIYAIMSALVSASGSAAYAQDREDVRVRVGIGPQLQPKFIGADKLQIAPLFDIDIARGDNLFRFEAPDDSFGIRLVSSDKFAFGPAANLEGKRKESEVGLPVGTVKATIEVGAFAEYLPAPSIRLRGEVMKGVNGHEGLVGSLGADKIWRDRDNYVVSIGPRIRVSDAAYQRAYFGVSPTAALASGLPAFRPGGGVHAIGLASGASYQFNPKWGVFGYARYDRLVGDAAESPIVRKVGSRNQMSGGIGLSYTFTGKR